MFIAFMTALLLLGFGGVCVFFKDVAWSWTEKSNRQRGIIESRRTREWESVTTWYGWFFILSGIVILVVVFMTQTDYGGRQVGTVEAAGGEFVTNS